VTVSEGITHPEKLMFPADGITKADLAAYYGLVAPVMLPHLHDRPLTMERFPQGIDKKGFIQKDVSKGFPEWLARVTVPKQGGVVHHPLINDARSLEWMANQNCITPHVWNRRATDLEHPDVCVFDLDPSEDDPAALRDAALAVRDILAERGLRSWVKTSGSKGFHIVVPIGGDAHVIDVAHFALGVAEALVARHPDRFTLEFSKADRGNKILVDIGRNGYSATFAAAYAVRPKPGAPISAPCTWDEVASGKVHPQSFTLRTMAGRLDAVGGDLWADLHANPAPLPPGSDAPSPSGARVTSRGVRGPRPERPARKPRARKPAAT
jgi:bifunctional non-homologous end joining protein LigD